MKNKIPIILFIIRIVIGFLFIYSGFIKLLQPIEYFEASISRYQVFPNILISPIAMTIPWVEFIFGFQLLLGMNTKISAFVLFILTIGFSLLISQALIRQLNINNCGCFGNGFFKIGLKTSLVIDCLMVLALFEIFHSRAKKWCLDNFYA